MVDRVVVWLSGLRDRIYKWLILIAMKDERGCWYVYKERFRHTLAESATVPPCSETGMWCF